jgi:hypothetical protein
LIKKTETIIIYELLDIERSLISLEGGGLVTGYGDGERISFKEFNGTHRTREPKLGVKKEKASKKTKMLRGAKGGVKDDCDVVEAKEESGFDSDADLIVSSDEEEEEEECTVLAAADAEL